MTRVSKILLVLLFLPFSSCKSDPKSFLWFLVIPEPDFPILKDISFEAGPNRLTRSYAIGVSGTSISISLPYGMVRHAIPTLGDGEGSWKLPNGNVIESGTTVLDLETVSELIYINSAGIETTYSLNVYQTVPVPDTEVSVCQNNTSFIPCEDPNLPDQDGDFLSTPNSTAYNAMETFSGYASDPVVLDSLSGLVWKGCLEGLSGAACATGTASTQSWTAAKATCESLDTANSNAGYAGRKGWRLVSRKEMDFSVGWLQSGVTLDRLPYKDIFLGRDSGSSYNIWTIEEDPSNSSQAFSFSVGACCGFPEAKTNSKRIQCVAGPRIPNPDFENSGTGIVLDKRTGIEWSKCPVGRSGSNCEIGTTTQGTYETLLTGCKNLSVGGKIWRLPNVNEITTLVDYSGGAFLSTAAFPVGISTATVPSWVYASTPAQNSNQVLTNSLIPAYGGIAHTGKSSPTDRTAVCTVR